MKKVRKVSVTITLFAGVFSACNIPAFLLQVNYLILYINERNRATENSRGPFMEWYGHLLSHFFLTFFNAAVNPCLYLLRMPRFRQWLKLVTKDPNMLFVSSRMLKRSATSSLWLTGSSTSRNSTRLVSKDPSRSLVRGGSNVVRSSTKNRMGSQRSRVVATKSNGHASVQEEEIKRAI